jgi:hypothetical protein
VVDQQEGQVVRNEGIIRFDLHGLLIQFLRLLPIPAVFLQGSQTEMQADIARILLNGLLIVGGSPVHRAPPH